MTHDPQLTSWNETDILVRISRTHPQHNPLAHEAAAEIERLRVTLHVIAINTRNPEREPPGGAEWKLKIIREMVKGYDAE